MIDAVPRLASQDVRACLEELFRRQRRHHLFAFFGTGDEGAVSIDGVGEIRLVPVRSELELRRRMPGLDSEDAKIAFLVPWTGEIPLDLAGRFALHGQVRRIGKDTRIKQLFGVGQLESAVARSPLVDHLLATAGTRRFSVGGGLLTVDAMWAAWLKQEWYVPTDGGLALDVLLGWAATSGRSAEFTAALASTPEVRDALLAHLGARLGPAGPAVWRAWESGRGRTALELAVLFEALGPSEHAGVRMWSKEKVRVLLGVEDEAVRLEVALALGREAPGAIRHVEKTVGSTEVRAVAADADALVDDGDVRAALASSTRLPSAWRHRLDALGAVLEAGAASPSAKALDASTDALRALEGHVFFSDEEQRPTILRAEMATRLLAWLTARPDQRLSPSPTPYGAAEALGRWYSEEGGYVDWARRWARGSEDAALGRGVQAVVRAADDARAALDRRFAAGLKGWVEAGAPSNQVLPLHDAVRRIATKYLDEDPERRLLVLLLDGMAWAQAVELLGSLGSRSAPWGPLAWHSTKAGRIGEGHHPVVFAGLPTVTEVSRSSFFAGKPMKPGASLNTGADPKHWAANPHVKKYSEGTDVPRLLLRSDGHTKGGSASSEALELVGDTRRRVVGIVVNAIDDALKASHAVRHPWRFDNIASLPDLLEKAREHHRAVMLVSDHGHVPADRIERVTLPHPGAKTEKGGARWRPWASPNAAVADNEIGLSGAHVYTPKGAHGVVMLTDDASAYAGNTLAGEHGGATLAEVVAPCLLIGCEDGMEVRAAYVPRWWHFDVRDETAVEVPSSPPVKTKPKRPKVPESQLGFAAIPVPVAEAAPSAFESSEVLVARVSGAADRTQVVRAVEALLARDCVMSADAFAAEMKILAFRVGGFISKLQEALNLDGYEVIRYDPSVRQVYLDREKLAQLFEVKL